MVSFDVASLFTNVPIQNAVQVVLRNLVNDRGLPDHTNLCDCGKVYIEKTVRAMRERYKNTTETRGLLVSKSPAISETGSIQLPIWDKVKVNDRDSLVYRKGQGGYSHITFIHLTSIEVVD